MKLPRALVLPFAIPVLGLAATVFADSRPIYHVIVHPKNPTVAMERKAVEDAFLKKSTRWSHGPVIRPVDLPADSNIRKRFSEDTLGRSVAAVKGYWQQRIFSGRDVPPPEVDGDEEAVKYVLKHEGAIGYVSGGTNLSGTRAVTVQ